MKNIKLSITRYIVRLLPVAYMGLIWFFSSYPSDAIVDTGLSFDTTLKEALHLVEFGILYLLWIIAAASLGKLNEKSNLLLAIFSAFYGLLDEIHQYFVPLRSATITDLIKDIIGICVAYYIVRRAFRVPGSKVKLWLKWIEVNLRKTSSVKGTE